MALAIDSEVPGCHIYKDVWSAGMDSELPCSLGSAIVRTSIYMPLHTYAPHVMLLIIVVGINFH